MKDKDRVVQKCKKF